jgi:hypothetical protein
VIDFIDFIAGLPKHSERLFKLSGSDLLKLAAHCSQSYAQLL